MRYLREIVGKTVKTHRELGVCPHVFIKNLRDLSPFRPDSDPTTFK